MFLEVPMLLIFFSIMLEDTVTTNFVLYRTCYILLGFNQSECALLGTPNANNSTVEIEKKVQPVASVILMSNTIVGSIIPVLCSFIFGPWSNKHGRKPILITTMLGFVIAYILVILYSILTWMSPWWLLVICFMKSLTGGFCSLLTVSFCYISDITTESDRDIRMGIFEAVITVGALLGTVSSSYIFAATGYIGIYSICAICLSLAVIYTGFFVRESVNNVHTEGSLTDLLDLSVVVTTFKTCFRRRENKDRTILCLLILVLVLYIFVLFSDGAIFFLYLREKFDWSLRKFTLFTTASNILGIVGMFFALYVLYKFLKINDLLLVAFALLTHVCTSLLNGFAFQDWHIYLGAVIRCMAGIIGPLTRSAISKITPPDELGNVFALTTSLESVTQVAAIPLYTYIYNKTLTVYPSAYNFLSAFIYGIDVCIASSVVMLKKFYPPIDVTLLIQEE